MPPFSLSLSHVKHEKRWLEDQPQFPGTRLKEFVFEASY